MAIVHSDLMTDALDLDSQVDYGQGIAVKGVSAFYTAAGALADNQVISFFELPVDALLDSLILNCDDLGTTGTLNVGLYPGRGSSVAVSALVHTSAVDEDCLGTLIDVNAAAVVNSELRFETADHVNLNKKLWEIGGLTSKPDYGTFIVAVTLSAATTAGGDISLKALYRG